MLNHVFRDVMIELSSIDDLSLFGSSPSTSHKRGWEQDILNFSTQGMLEEYLVYQKRESSRVFSGIPAQRSKSLDHSSSSVSICSSPIDRCTINHMRAVRFGYYSVTASISVRLRVVLKRRRRRQGKPENVQAGMRRRPRGFLP